MTITRFEGGAVTRAVPTAPTETVDFPSLVAMGDHLVKTGFLPAHLRTGAQVAAIVLTGRELGMPPMRALRSLVMVKGKVTEAADSLLARFKSDGGRAQFRQLDETQAVLWLRHPNGDEHTETFTIADAKRAGIATEMYSKYPKAMLRSRAITAALKSLGWEGGSGVYDPSELVEVAAVEAPVADEPAARPAPVPLTDPQVREAAEAEALAYDAAAAIVLRGRVLGEMSDDRLQSVLEWAKQKGNRTIAAACYVLLEGRALESEAAAEAEHVGAASAGEAA
jgi:hypothetical protein